MGSVVAVNPFRCRMWPLHDRLEEYINEVSCRSEIESFAKQGQLVAVLGRPVKNDPDCDVELIYGSRRLFVARHLNKPLTVELREISDREALIAMDIENRQRQDISPYERGLSYARWLRSGHFRSQDEVARTLGVSASQISRLLNLARLPSVILSAFASPADICEMWGLELLKVWSDPKRRPRLAQTARELAAAPARPSPQRTYEQLLASGSPGRRSSPQQLDEVVEGTDGVPLLRIRRRRKRVMLVLLGENVNTQRLERIKHAVCEILQHASSQAADLNQPAARLVNGEQVAGAAPCISPGG